MPVKDIGSRSFAVRASLAQRRPDARIQLSSSSSSPVHKPVTYRFLLYWFFAGMFGLYLLMGTAINPAKGGVLGSILFIIGYIMICKLLLSRSDTMDYGYVYPLRLLQYFTNDDIKHVRTGKLYDDKPVYNLIGIAPRGISPDGTITFVNGEVGYVLSVVGCASTMMFKNNQKDVLQAAQIFYRNLPPSVSVNVYTRSKPQDITEQFNQKIDTLYKLKHGIKSPGLSQIVKAQARVLRDIVGKQFLVTNQYMLIRGDQRNVESTLRQLLVGIGSSNSNFLRSARLLRNQPPQYNSRGETTNRAYEVDEALRSIFDLFKDNDIQQ